MPVPAANVTPEPVSNEETVPPRRLIDGAVIVPPPELLALTFTSDNVPDTILTENVFPALIVTGSPIAFWVTESGPYNDEKDTPEGPCRSPAPDTVSPSWSGLLTAMVVPAFSVPASCRTGVATVSAPVAPNVTPPSTMTSPPVPVACKLALPVIDRPVSTVRLPP